MTTKKQLEVDIVKLKSEKAKLQQAITCSNLYLHTSVMGIILATENAFKVTLAKEPVLYNETLASLCLGFLSKKLADSGQNIVDNKMKLHY